MIRPGINLVNKAFNPNLQLVRNKWYTTYPRVRMPFWEKVTHGVIFSVAVMAYPSYVAFNVKNYRGEQS